MERPRCGGSLYRLLLVIMAPLLVGYLALLAWRSRSWRLFAERLGFPRGDRVMDVIWVHAASVGEVNAARPLVELLGATFPERAILLTTNTASGAATALRTLPAGIRHAYLPVDWSHAVRRFLRRYRPSCGLIMETEIWPNLYRTCNERKVPLVVVNGRVSPRTLEAPRWLRRVYCESLKRVRRVLARSERDKAGFIKLGADPTNVEVVGNIKFAGRLTVAAPIDLGHPYVVAASTRDDEEPLLAEAWRRAETGDRLLVVVPRHPQRASAIRAALGDYRLAQRSRGDAVNPETEIYLADTFGELGGFLAGGEAVIMGGSFVPLGGQNLLEPAQLGKAILCGPHMDNFLDETERLKAAGGLIQVADANALSSALGELLADGARRLELGERARQVFESEADVAERYLSAIRDTCAW